MQLLNVNIYFIFCGASTPFRAMTYPYWASRSHSGRLRSGRLISPTQGLLPDNIQHSQETNFHTAGGIRTHNSSKRAAAELRLRPHGHKDRLNVYLLNYNSSCVGSDINYFEPLVPWVRSWYCTTEAMTSFNNTGQQNFMIFFVPRTSIDELSSTFYAEFRYV